LSTDRIHSQAWRVKEKLEMHDNKHELKVLMLDGTTGFYRVQRYRVGDFFGPVDLGIHLAFKHNALTWRRAAGRLCFSRIQPAYIRRYLSLLARFLCLLHGRGGPDF
jgi:hypothetical protein